MLKIKDMYGKILKILKDDEDEVAVKPIKCNCKKCNCGDKTEDE